MRLCGAVLVPGNRCPNQIALEGGNLSGMMMLYQQMIDEFGGRVVMAFV